MKLHLILNFTSVIDILADSVHCNSNGQKLFSWLKARVKIFNVARGHQQRRFRQSTTELIHCFHGVGI